MKHTAIALTCVLLLMGAGSLGCARAAKDTSGFALREEGALKASFEDSWHAVKRVLRDQGYEIYTRDKRGAFVAYTPMKRVLWTQPRRTKFMIELAETSPGETAIAIESVRQVYGVTLLTHPNWHDRKQNDPAPSQKLLEGIQAKITEGLETEAFGSDAAPAPETAEDATAAPVLDAPPAPPAEEVAVEEAATVN